MKPNISEFSYGFALTYELVLGSGSPIQAAPVFPSLIQEGQKGGGWDVRLQRPTGALFLQFKLSDYMKRSTCKEALQNFPIPCYRMHIRPSRQSDQHQLLLELEGNGHDVYYCAPTFHEPEQLDDAFVDRTIASRSIWLRPSDIGPLPDSEDHSVAFLRDGPCAVSRTEETWRLVHSRPS